MVQTPELPQLKSKKKVWFMLILRSKNSGKNFKFFILMQIPNEKQILATILSSGLKINDKRLH